MKKAYLQDLMKTLKQVSSFLRIWDIGTTYYLFYSFALTSAIQVFLE